MGIPALAFVHVELKTKPKALQLLENPLDIGQHIRKKRIEMGLKQSELAKLLGVCEDTITGWENGRTLPQIRNLKNINLFLQ